MLQWRRRARHPHLHTTVLKLLLADTAHSTATSCWPAGGVKLDHSSTADSVGSKLATPCRKPTSCAFMGCQPAREWGLLLLSVLELWKDEGFSMR